MEYYLVHHGILGQKWGIRRYQNFDGTLTAAGRARYGDSDYGNITRFSRKHAELVNKYKDRGLTPDEAEYAAKRYLRTKRRIGVALGVTAVVAATYLATNDNARKAVTSVVEKLKNTPLEKINTTNTTTVTLMNDIKSLTNNTPTTRGHNPISMGRVMTNMTIGTDSRGKYPVSMGQAITSMRIPRR